MKWNDATENEAARVLQTSYILWAVGLLDPEVVEDLESLTPPGQESWREIMDRQCPWSRQELQRQFVTLCETLSDDDALDVLLTHLESRWDRTPPRCAPPVRRATASPRNDRPTP